MNVNDIKILTKRLENPDEIWVCKASIEAKSNNGVSCYISSNSDVIFFEDPKDDLVVKYKKCV